MSITNKEKIKHVLPHIAFVVLYAVFLFIYLKVENQNNRLIRIAEVSSDNISMIFTMHFMSSILVLIVIVFINHYRKKSLSNLGICIKHPVIIAVLSVVYLGFFIIRGNFSVGGIYTAFFYLVVVAFLEELIFRGYLFGVLNESFDNATSVVISGIIFGAMHAITPIIINGTNPLIVVSSEIGGGIVASAFFVFLYRKSGTLLIPILVHALLDYCPLR